MTDTIYSPHFSMHGLDKVAHVHTSLAPSGLAGARGGFEQRPAPSAPGRNERPAPRATKRPGSCLGVKIPGSYFA